MVSPLLMHNFWEKQGNFCVQVLTLPIIKPGLWLFQQCLESIAKRIQAVSSANYKDCLSVHNAVSPPRGLIHPGLDYLLSLKGWMFPTDSQECTYLLYQLNAVLLHTPMNCQNQQKATPTGLQLLFPLFLIFHNLKGSQIFIWAFDIMLFIYPNG